MFKPVIFLSFLIICLSGCQSAEEKTSDITVKVSFSDNISSRAQDGRLLLMLSSNNEDEPRFQINSGLNTQVIFGMNVNEMTPNVEQTFDASDHGFPYASLAELPPGEYWVQALLHIYETFNLSTGHTVKLPMDNGEGQKWKIR